MDGIFAPYRHRLGTWGVGCKYSRYLPSVFIARYLILTRLNAAKELIKNLDISFCLLDVRKMGAMLKNDQLRTWDTMMDRFSQDRCCFVIATTKYQSRYENFPKSTRDIPVFQGTSHTELTWTPHRKIDFIVFEFFESFFNPFRLWVNMSTRMPSGECLHRFLILRKICCAFCFVFLNRLSHILRELTD